MPRVSEWVEENPQSLGEWIEEEFGARDEGLLDLDVDESEVELTERELTVEYEHASTEMEEVEDRYKETLQAAIETDDETELEQYKRKAKLLKKKHQARSRKRDGYGLGLTATFVVRALDAVGEEDPEAVERRVEESLVGSPIGRPEKINEYLAAVSDAIAIEWLPGFSFRQTTVPDSLQLPEEFVSDWEPPEWTSETAWIASDPPEWVKAVIDRIERERNDGQETGSDETGADDWGLDEALDPDD